MTKQTMLAVLKARSTPGVELQRIAIPDPKEGELLVKVKAASICGTDISIYDWTPWAEGHIKPPVVIGHEIVGEVIEINPSASSGQAVYAEDIKIGDFVSSETHIFCGSCYQCRIGNRHICENMELFGIGRNGGFAEYATIPIRTSWKNERSVPIEWMSTQEPLGNAVHVVTKAKVSGKRVVVFGLGPTGLCAVAAAKAYGAKEVIGINRGEYRRKLGKSMGCDATYDELPKALVNQCDVVLEMSGNASSFVQGLEAARIAGTMIAFGIPKSDVSLNAGKYLINKELTISSVFGRRIWETWYQVSDLLKSKKVNLGKIITHECKLKDFEKAVAIMKSGKCGKILLRP
ncbi:alcohol dehydrogenase catalytic domain-containing protein [Candidatus Gottesmanbacteria bacterium]|nr:alcohol dehydrogenase catalytic domain-containing protein [Candidatus Gottesmanbacteria bacterium]